MKKNNLPTIYNKINNELKNSGHKYAVLDFDNTCIFNDIGEATLFYLCEHKLLKNKNLLSSKQNYHKAVFEKYHFLLDNNKIQEAYELAARVLAGYSIDEIPDLVKKVIRYEGKKLRKRILFSREINAGLKVRQNTKKIMDYLIKKNIEVWIVSASAKVLVEQALKKFFPDYKYKCIGIELEIKNNLLINKIIYPTSTLEGKPKCIKKYINSKIHPIIAIGDSMNDLAMLEYSKIKSVVDRKNSLSDIAKKRNWFLI